MSWKQRLIDQWQRLYDLHSDLSLEAQEQGYDVAREYHERLAQQYLAMLESPIKQDKGGDD